MGVHKMLMGVHENLSAFDSKEPKLPEDYCLSPLNTSDCGRPPIPVFYYYKSGSRCEIKLWRGCPTGNLFNTEYHCSHHCIGRLWSSEQDAKVESFSKTSLVDTLTGLKYKCDIPIDTSQCKQAKQFVYTYDIKKKKCIKVTYYGCPTENKFRDEEECQDICEKSEDQWEHAVKEMDLDELHNESKEPTEKPEKPTDEPVAPTDKTTITTTEEESETKAETEPAVATTNSVHEKGTEAEETTKLPVSTKRTRRKRVTKNSHDEGDVVREGELQDYCSAPLNKSDCGLSPTPVFSYYKPGSICKIAMWRGCQPKKVRR
ncbi:hypothetical protein MSG28_003643 [Choristoneura fumiferana]|uniref:Uncharacterized protein n=1 Tax=Choristoneura fumiferana TaxID=7141 RepID=A0ACC0KFW8_CHOFU|nr:hypothetical protein MSG28_003643 [Choristoneura fumiferana]